MHLDPGTVIVCGGREYATPYLLDGSVNPLFDEQTRVLHQELNFLRRAMIFTHLVHGGAVGADEAAGLWAQMEGIRVTTVSVLSGEHPKMRNMRMWQLHMPRFVLAFPGRGGTAHMVEYARSMGSRALLLPRPQEDRGGTLL